MTAGQSTTCGICGERVETPPRDLVIAGEVIAKDCVIDLDQGWRDFLAHYDAKHPDAERPERVW